MREYTLGDIAFERSESCKTAKEYSHIVGLEHLIPEQVELTEWSDPTEDNTFTKMFREGDVLFGRRRAYLKKASVAPFDGICSGDITVIVAKPDIICPSLLPFVIQNDRLFEYAVKMSAGGLSPRVKWKDLKLFPLLLPEMPKQETLADLLWSMEYTKRAYRKMIEATDELVKSQFIERFEERGYKTFKAKTFMTNMRNGVSPSKKGSHAEKVLTLSAVTQGTFDPDAWKDGIFDECPPFDKRINTSEFYMCRGNGNKTLVGTAVYSVEERHDLVFPDTVIAAHIDSNVILMPFLFVAWKMPKVHEQIESSARTTNGTYKINQTVLSNVELIVPPIDKQAEFVSFLEQSDKSKFELQKSLAELTAMQKKIIEQNLT